MFTYLELAILIDALNDYILKLESADSEFTDFRAITIAKSLHAQATHDLQALDRRENEAPN